MLTWRIWYRISLIIGLICLNLRLVAPIYGQTSLHAEKLWQYGQGVIQDFDWIEQTLILATSNGIWQTSPTFNKPATRFNPAFSQPPDAFEKGEGWTSRLISSLDGTRFLSQDGDARWRIRDAHNGAILVTLSPKTNIHVAAWQPNGGTIATEIYDAAESSEQQSKVALWDTQTGKVKITLGGSSSPIAALSWNPAGTLLAVRLVNGKIAVEDIVQVKRLRDLTADPISTTVIAWSPDGTKLAAAANMSSSLKLWRTDTFDVLTLPNQPMFIDALAWNADSKKLAGILPDGTVETWDVETGDIVPLSPKTNTTASNASVRLVWNGEQLGELDRTQQVRIWNTQTKELIGKSAEFKSNLNAMAVSRDGASIALSYHGSNEIDILDGKTGLLKQTLDTDPTLTLEVTDISWNFSGQLLAVGSGKTLYIWQPLANPKAIQVHNIFAPQFSWSPNDMLGVVSRVDQKEVIRFIDGKTGKQALPARQEPNLAFIHWSPDGSQIAMYRYKESDTDTAPVQLDILNLQQNAITTLKFPFSGTSRMTPTDSFLWIPNSSGLVGYTAAPVLLWKWNVNESEAHIIASVTNSIQANQAFPLKSNERGDMLATIVAGEAIVLKADTGQEILRLGSTSPLNNLFGWGGNDKLFIYNGAVQAYQLG